MIQEREQPATIPRKFIVSRLVWRFSGEEKEGKSKRKREGGREGREMIGRAQIPGQPLAEYKEGSPIKNLLKGPLEVPVNIWLVF